MLKVHKEHEKDAHKCQQAKQEHEACGTCLAFKLTPIRHEVALRECHLPGNLSPQVLHRTDQIPPGHIGRDDDSASDVLAHNDVRSAIVLDVGQQPQGQQFPPVHIDGQRLDSLDIVTRLIGQSQDHVKTLLPIEYLCHDFAVQGHLYVLGHFTHHCPILGGFLAVETHIELWNEYLLFRLQIDDPGHGRSDTFDLRGFTA